MMEEELRGEGFPLRDCLITCGISFVMSLSSFFSLFTALPLLGFSARHSRRNTLLVFLIDAVIFTVHAMYEMKGSAYYPLMVLMDLYIPLSLSAAGMIWTVTKGRKADVRLTLASLPAFCIILFVAVVFCADGALFEAVYNGYRDAFVPVIEELFDSLGVSGVDTEMFFLVLITAASVVMLPLVTGAGCASFFIHESVMHSREGGWNEKLDNMEFSQKLIWLLIVSLFIFLLSRFVSVPDVVFILSMSVLTSVLIIYGAEGYTVLFSWIRRGIPNFRSTTLFVLLVVTGLFIPGLNLFVLIVVPVLGILENFFDLKKRKER